MNTTGNVTKLTVAGPYLVRPNPTIISGWRCPVCHKSTVDYGTTRRRISPIPWKRLVHVHCEPAR